MKNQFGYVKSKGETGGQGGAKQQPPISRPVPSPLPASAPGLQQQLGQQDHQLMGGPQLNSMVRGILDQQQRSSYHQQQQQQPLDQNSLLAKRFQAHHQQLPSSNHLQSNHLGTNHHRSSILASSPIAELTGASLQQPACNQSINPYEKWSNGSDSLFGLPTHPSQEAFKVSHLNYCRYFNVCLS